MAGAPQGMRLVMDANALIASIGGEVGGDVVDQLLLDSANECYVHAVNLCEVYYDFHRTHGEAKAREVIGDLVATGLLIREDMDVAFWEHAGQLKSKLARISLADCFCTALAARLSAQVVTADHHEFDAVAEQKLCTVRFIR